MRASHLKCVVIALIPAGTAMAQEAAAPAELAALQAGYRESISIADRAVLSQWISSLGQVEKERVAAGDYQGAERVRSRREEIVSRLGTNDGRVSRLLSASDLSNKGSGLTVNDGGRTVTLSSTGAFLEWEVTGDFKGWYEVKLTHAVAGTGDHTAEVAPATGLFTGDKKPKKNDPYNPVSATGGWVSFQHVSGLKRNDTALRREIVSTGGFNAFRTVSLGRMEIKGSLAKFKLAADEAGKLGLMHFKNIELVPMPPPSVSATEGEQELAKARELFDKEFRTQTQAASTRYRDALTQLEQQFRHKDTDALVRVRDEKTKLIRSPEQLALGSDDAATASVPPIRLDATNTLGCQFRGDIRPDAARSILTNLRPAGSAAVTWRLAAYNVGSGIYRVTIKGRVPLLCGGTATLTASGPANTPAGKPLNIVVEPLVTIESRVKKPTPGVTQPAAGNRDVDAGALVVEKGAETLTLAVTGLTHVDGSLMDVACLTLTRTGDVPPAK